jgi:hypothetical protein
MDNNSDCKLPASHHRTHSGTLFRTGVEVENAVSFESLLGDVVDNPSIAMIDIVVKRTGGSEAPCLELSIEKDATVLELKTLIQRELAEESPCLMVPVERQRLLFAGKMLTQDDLRLVEDINMKTGTLNYIHLAPLPKDVIPSKRTRYENKLTSRRHTLGRTNRTFSPYSMSVNRRRGRGPQVEPSGAFLAQSGLYESPRGCRGTLSDLRPSVVDSLSSCPSFLPALDNLPERNPGAMTDESIAGLSSELMPLCQMIHSNVNQIVRCSQDARSLETTEHTILLLEQLSQRSSSMARSLRTNLRHQRHRQLLSVRGLLEDNLPWGSY